MHISKQKQVCDKCNRSIQKSNFSKHYKSCGLARPPQFSCDSWFDKQQWKCPHCSFEGKTRQSATSHYWRNHTENGLTVKVKNPASKLNGRHNSWNKGLTKETDLRVAKNAKSLSIVSKGKSGRPHTEETKRKISQKLSINNKGGRAKWYEVAGQKVQGTWERNVALKLEELGIAWKKLKNNRDTLEYVMDNKTRCYTPDFYLPSYNIFLEIKGYWWGRDREKMDIVLKTHQDKKIVIIEKEQYEKFLGGELVW